MREIVARRVLLREQDVDVLTKPAARPWLVCPGEAERKVWAPAPERVLEGFLQQPSPVEPVVPIAEGFDSVLLRELGLSLACLGHAEIVEAEVCGEVGLVVPCDQRLFPYDVC